jgi:hypothetical protein
MAGCAILCGQRFNRFSMTGANMPKIQLELKDDDPEMPALESSLGKQSFIRARPDHFEGDVNIVNLLVDITTVTIPVLSLFITQHIKAKRYIKAKVKGIDVQGESLQNIEAFLEKVARQQGEPLKKDLEAAGRPSGSGSSKKNPAKTKRSKKEKMISPIRGSCRGISRTNSQNHTIL